jgi:formamidopyrimidine-DNA glycosylase
MDQRLVAIGNICANEILFEAESDRVVKHGNCGWRS